ncbi:hypothetical protein XENORESO_011541 [Xenotaenia resolanae]|uniref:Secreted protein n=1 Tax=Xenotaenia resolanae TaxID=208358 RepID=A0ABV0VRR0_9TELE
MAKTRLFALGICLWHTHSHCEHMLHACHSPCKRSKSETLQRFYGFGTAEAKEYKAGEGEQQVLSFVPFLAFLPSQSLNSYNQVLCFLKGHLGSFILILILLCP